MRPETTVGTAIAACLPYRCAGVKQKSFVGPLLQIRGGIYFESAKGSIFFTPFKTAAIAGSIQVIRAVEVSNFTVVRINGSTGIAEADGLLLLRVEVNKR